MFAKGRTNGSPKCVPLQWSVSGFFEIISNQFSTLRDVIYIKMAYGAYYGTCPTIIPHPFDNLLSEVPVSDPCLRRSRTYPWSCGSKTEHFDIRIWGSWCHPIAGGGWFIWWYLLTVLLLLSPNLIFRKLNKIYIIARMTNDNFLIVPIQSSFNLSGYPAGFRGHHQWESETCPEPWA